MAGSELKKLKRADLLELLIAQGKELDRIKAELDEAREQLSRREIALAEAGSIADAALKLSGVFESAQEAADIYLLSLQANGAELYRGLDAKMQSIEAIKKQMLEETAQKCAEMELEARLKCDEIWADGRDYAKDFETYGTDTSNTYS